jgi:hypothetical protein
MPSLLKKVEDGAQLAQLGDKDQRLVGERAVKTHSIAALNAESY